MGKWNTVRAVTWEEGCLQTEEGDSGPQSRGILRRVVVAMAAFEVKES